MAQVQIDGVIYDLPGADSYTLDEWQLFYDESHIKPEDLEELGNGFHPGATKAALLIAVRRARPDYTVREILARIGQMTLQDLRGVFVDEEGDDQPDPLDGETEPDEPADSSGGNGEPGSTISPEPSLPASSGLPGSATTSTYDPKTLVP